MGWNELNTFWWNDMAGSENQPFLDCLLLKGGHLNHHDSSPNINWCARKCRLSETNLIIYSNAFLALLCWWLWVHKSYSNPPYENLSWKAKKSESEKKKTSNKKGRVSSWSIEAIESVFVSFWCGTFAALTRNSSSVQVDIMEYQVSYQKKRFHSVWFWIPTMCIWIIRWNCGYHDPEKERINQP